MKTWFCIDKLKGKPGLVSLNLIFKDMISSPYCAVSEPNVYKHYKQLTRWNANQCYSLRTTYLIFETF